VLPTQELSQGETSPYGALSAFAIDPIYLDIERIPDLDAAAIAKRAAQLLRELKLTRVKLPG